MNSPLGGDAHIPQAGNPGAGHSGVTRLGIDRTTGGDGGSRRAYGAVKGLCVNEETK